MVTPKAGREGELGVEALEQGVQDDLVEAAVEVASTVEQALRHGQPLGESGLERRPDLADEPSHVGILGDESG